VPPPAAGGSGALDGALQGATLSAILSARAGAAVIIDRGEVSLLRAGAAGERTPCRGDEWRRFLGEGRDLHALADVTLEEVERRLCRARDGQRALRALMTLCDGTRSEKVRGWAAEDLEALLAAPEVAAELEAILYAAPLPAHLDRDGAARIAADREAGQVLACLDRWGLRQRAVRTVEEAWEGLPDTWFKDREERRWVRAIAVREGLFRAVVEAVHAGRPPGAILHEVLRNPATRVVRNAARLMAEWLRRLPQTTPPAKAEALGPDVLELEEPLTPRYEAPVPAAEKLQGVKGVLGEFASLLPVTRGAEALTELIAETRQKLEAIQGRKKDRRHFAKSLCRMADLLKAQGALDHAIALLQWAIANGMTDAYTYTALLDAHGKAGDVDQARQVFDAALRAGMADSVTYTTLVDAYGKAGALEQARQILDAAIAAGVAEAYTYNALVDAYRKAGDAEQTRQIFDAAARAGVADAYTYTALVEVYAKTGDLKQARRFFDEATGLPGAADAYTYNALLDAYGKAGDLEQARQIFDAAVRAGVADAYSYPALLDAYGKAGALEQARQVFDAAVRAGVATPITYTALVDAFGKAGALQRARQALDVAVRAGMADAYTYTALVDAYGKAGELDLARRIFDAALAGRTANAGTYNALLDAYGKAGELEQARQIFDAAVRAGVASAITYNALADAHGKAGDAAQARRIFDAAVGAGVVNAITYNTLVDAYGRAGDVAQARQIFDEAVRTRVENAGTYSALVDAYGKAGDLEGAQAIFDAAVAARAANAVTHLVLLRCALRHRRISLVESLVERTLRLDRVNDPVGGRSLATTIAWSAARLRRSDWLAQLPERNRSARGAFAFALRSADPRRALEEVRRHFPRAFAAEVLLRYRLAREPDDYVGLLEECEHGLAEHGLDAFNRARLVQSLARCRRQLGWSKALLQGWRRYARVSVPASDAATRASLLSASGRDLLVAGLRDRNDPLALEGARRLLHGWSLARNANPYDPETAWTLAETLESYGAAGDGLAQRGRTPFTRRLEALLARGALDGYAAIALLREADLPEELLGPARRGIAFLQRLRPPGRPRLVL
jgi:pentatricopeptide repeat domain-containing protein 1